MEVLKNEEYKNYIIEILLINSRTIDCVVTGSMESVSFKDDLSRFENREKARRRDFRES